MAQIEEIDDEHFEGEQVGPADDDYYTDTDSEVTDDEDDLLEETIAERISALRDMIPPRHREAVINTVSSAYSWIASGLVFSAKSAYILSTGAIFIGMPFALAFVEEQQYMEMEKEAKMQQSANEVLAPGASSSTLSQTKAAL